jgi:pimeloyl-ACP methyl ester carboxylesterase
MRAAYPDREGIVERDGAKIAFEVYECAGAPTLLMTQTWQVLHSRHWKLMIPYLSRHYRVVTYDPVGNGKSDRIFDGDRYGHRSQVDDAVAVLDATGTATAIPTHAWTIAHPNREASYAGMFDRVENPQGWDKYNTHYWRENWDDFVKFFFAECCSNPHSTRLWDDTTAWAMETEGELIALAGEGKEQISYEDMKAAVTSMRMPVLIIHGTDDRVVSYESSLRLQKRIAHAQLLTIPNSSNDRSIEEDHSIDNTSHAK